MKTRILATTLALAVCMLGIGTHAYAADPVPAPMPMKGVEITGKAICKSETKDGKTTKVCSITVFSAKGADGKPIADLNGKTLKVTGAKSAEIEKLADKDIVAHGTVSVDKSSYELDSAMVKLEHHEKAK